ncbi:MAG TPA: serine protease, partial [Roseburia sp.]|nr:serine protease [Roseburia sp.]
IPKGVYIKEVKMDSPAMAAGLQSGDVITEIDGEAVISVDGYQTKLLSLTPGDVAEVTIQRQGNDGYTEIKCPVTVSVLQ